MGSTRRGRGYLKRQTRDVRRALIAACVEKESHATPHTHTHVYIHTNVYILYSLTYYSMLTVYTSYKPCVPWRGQGWEGRRRRGKREKGGGEGEAWDEEGVGGEETEE